MNVPDSHLRIPCEWVDAVLFTQCNSITSFGWNCDVISLVIYKFRQIWSVRGKPISECPIWQPPLEVNQPRNQPRSRADSKDCLGNEISLKFPSRQAIQKKNDTFATTHSPSLWINKIVDFIHLHRSCYSFRTVIKAHRIDWNRCTMKTNRKTATVNN